MRQAGADPGDAFTRAVADYDAALKLNPHSAAAWMQRGFAHTNGALSERAAGRGPGPLLRAAVADFDRALREDPRHAESLWRRGEAHRMLGEWAEAAADLEAAVRVNPALAPTVRASLEEVRRRVEGAGH